MEQIVNPEVQVKERTPEVEARRVEVDRQLAEWQMTTDQAHQKLSELSAARDPMLAALSVNARSTCQRLLRMSSRLVLAEARG